MKLDLSGLTLCFGTHRVLDDLSWQADGHALVFIGPSGGGKSTLLRVLAGLEHPDSGTLAFDGQPLSFTADALLRHRREVGVVFQSYNLFPHLTALDNIMLPLTKVHGLSEDEARERAMEHLKRFQLEDHARKKPAHLSGGQRQRVAIVRAIAIRPRLLLFDEPTSALDPEMTGEVLDMIAGLREEGRDLILVTHHLAFARTVADQVAFLADGKIVEHGTHLFAGPETVACRRFLSRVLRY